MSCWIKRKDNFHDCLKKNNKVRQSNKLSYHAISLLQHTVRQSLELSYRALQLSYRVDGKTILLIVLPCGFQDNQDDCNVCNIRHIYIYIYQYLVLVIYEISCFNCQIMWIWLFCRYVTFVYRLNVLVRLLVDNSRYAIKWYY